MASNDNPYTTPKTNDAANERSRRDFSANRVRWTMYSVIALMISAIPIYGFFTHAARDSQNTVLWIMLAWIVSLINALTMFVRSLMLAKTDRSGAMLCVAVSMTLACMLVIGFYGIGDAVAELWAG